MMARLIILMLLGAVIMTMAPLSAGILNDQTPDDVARLFQRLNNAKPKVTRLHFYLQNNFTGNEATIVPVAQANVTATSPTSFGLVSLFDGALTEQPAVNSKEIGRAQGISGFASKEETAFSEFANYVFTDGKYNGSTLQLVGHGPVQDQYKEFSISGGTGALRLARGSGFFKTLLMDDVRETIEVNLVFYEY